MAPSSRTRKHRLAAGTAFIGLLGSMSACYWLTSTDDLTGGDGGNVSPSPDGAIEGGPGSDANDDVVYPPGSGWKLTFRDEFNGNALGTGWATEYPRQGERAHSDPDNGEAQWYLKQNVVVSGGTLKLIAKREEHQASQTFHYTSGMVQSKSLVSFQYGYIEAKIKWPKGSGLHPAFWSWPMSESSAPELDIASFAGHEPGNVTCLLRPQNGQQSLREVPADNGDWTTDWHTYAVDSEPNRAIWYFDGQRVHDAPSTGGTLLYLMLTFAITTTPPATGTTLPATYEIDYVRVFTK